MLKTRVITAIAALAIIAVVLVVLPWLWAEVVIGLLLLVAGFLLRYLAWAAGLGAVVLRLLTPAPERAALDVRT